ncbi:MAG TPA: hypothetical protein VIF62_01780 [Labilithrix sp.]
MDYVFVIIVGVVVLVQIARAVSRSRSPSQSAGALDALAASGIPARGLVLSCSQYAIGVTLSQRRFEKRTMTIDVEIPGREPYVATGDFLVPRGLLEVVPGASLDLSVDARDPNRIVVLGPGGFTGPWLRVGPPAAY